MTERIVVDYIRRMKALEQQVEQARAEVAKGRRYWRPMRIEDRLALDASAEQAEIWQARLDDGLKALATYADGKRRLVDALVQLRALALRSGD